ncbi:unnamed protein product, partial [Orchesella dallaii]
NQGYLSNIRNQAVYIEPRLSVILLVLSLGQVYQTDLIRICKQRSQAPPQSNQHVLITMENLIGNQGYLSNIRNQAVYIEPRLSVILLVLSLGQG